MLTIVTADHSQKQIDQFKEVTKQGLNGRYFIPRDLLVSIPDIKMNLRVLENVLIDMAEHYTVPMWISVTYVDRGMHVHWGTTAKKATPTDDNTRKDGISTIMVRKIY